MIPYQPDELPLEGLNYRQLIALVGDANAELARYDGLLRAIVNPRLMLSTMSNHEAVLSSKIEGTQATVDDVLELEAGMVKDSETEKDIQEIINYRNALRAAEQYLTDRPITLSFVRELHKILLTSVRGQDKTPGEFRKDQNWIGKYGCTIEEASFVPPNPLQLPSHLDAWQQYMAIDDSDILLQTAVVHAQFELLHPFSDGNGRIGRLLIPLFLFQKKKLEQPMFYISEYLEANREEYYVRLQNISRERDWNSWIVFFLGAITEQAKSNIVKVKEIMALHSQLRKEIYDLTRSQYTGHVLDAIFERPIFRTFDFVTRTGILKPTAMGLLKQLKNANILIELQSASGRRPSVLCFPDLINTVEGRRLV